MCSCSWLYKMLSFLRQKEKLFYQWAFCLFPPLLVLARLCPVKYLTEGLVGIAFTLPTLDCFSFLHLFWTRYWISKKVRRNAQSIWKNLILDMREKMIFCYQNYSELLWENIVLVIEKNLCMSNFSWTIWCAQMTQHYKLSSCASSGMSYISKINSFQECFRVLINRSIFQLSPIKAVKIKLFLIRTFKQGGLNLV